MNPAIPFAVTGALVVAVTILAGILKSRTSAKTTTLPGDESGNSEDPSQGRQAQIVGGRMSATDHFVDPNKPIGGNGQDGQSAGEAGTGRPTSGDGEWLIRKMEACVLGVACILTLLEQIRDLVKTQRSGETQ